MGLNLVVASYIAVPFVVMSAFLGQRLEPKQYLTEDYAER